MNIFLPIGAAVLLGWILAFLFYVAISENILTILKKNYIDILKQALPNFETREVSAFSRFGFYGKLQKKEFKAIDDQKLQIFIKKHFLLRMVSFLLVVLLIAFVVLLIIAPKG